MSEAAGIGSIRPGLRKERKELAGKYYQLLSGHAANRGLIGRQDKDPVERVLVVRQRGETDPPPPLRQVQDLAPLKQKMWKSVGKAWGWDTRFGMVISLALLAPPVEENGEGWGKGKKERGAGLARLETVYFSCLSLFCTYFYLFILFFRHLSSAV